MNPRLAGRRRRKRVLAVLVGLALFAGSIWLALVLAAPSRPRAVRVVGRGSAPAVTYQLDPAGNRVIVRGEVSPGREEAFEVTGTGEGLLIRPVPAGTD